MNRYLAFAFVLGLLIASTVATSIKSGYNITADVGANWTAVGTTDSSLAGTATVGVKAQVGTASTDDSGVVINRTATNPIAGGGSHGVRDESTYQSSAGPGGYASYDSIATMTGNTADDHYTAFQSRPIYTGSLTLGGLNGLTTHATHSGTGLISAYTGFDVFDATGTGEIQSQYGLHIRDLTHGDNNYGVVTEGAVKSFFAGGIGIGTLAVGSTNQLAVNDYTTEDPNAAVVVSSRQPGTVYGPDMMVNGDFETAGGTIWFNWTVSGTTSADTTTASEVHRFNHAAKMTSTGSGYSAGILQQKTVVPSTTYLLSFWTRGDGAASGSYYVWDSTHGAYLIALTDTAVSGATYQRVTNSFTAPAGCVTTTINFFSPAATTGTAYYDQVSLKKVYTSVPKGLVVQGISGQVGNLQEWQASTGSILATIHANGSVSTGSDTNQWIFKGLTVDGGTTNAHCIINGTNFFWAVTPE